MLTISQMKIQLLFPCLLIVSAFACKKPAPTGYDPAQYNEPIIFLTSLRDSIPTQKLIKLNLEKIEGIKVKYPSGLYSSYFEYESDHRELIRTIGSLPFPMTAQLADTTCHVIPYAYLTMAGKNLPETELASAATFWSANPGEYTPYECIKGEFKHTLLISNNSRKVLHRVQFIG